MSILKYYSITNVNMDSDLSPRHFMSSNMFTGMGYLSVTSKSLDDVDETISEVQTFIENKFNQMKLSNTDRDLHLTFHFNQYYFPDDEDAIDESNFDEDAICTFAIREQIDNELVNIVASSVYVQELVDQLLSKQKYVH